MTRDCFFNFNSDLDGNSAYVIPYNFSDNEDELLLKGDYADIQFPVIFKQESEGVFYDVIYAGYPNLYLISDKLKCILEENHLTGWQTYPISLFDKNENNISGYYGFSILGRCSSASYDKSNIIDQQDIPNGPISKVCKGLLIEDWDGSDFFNPTSSCRILITKKAANVIKKTKISNLKTKNVADITIYQEFA